MVRSAPPLCLLGLGVCLLTAQPGLGVRRLRLNALRTESGFGGSAGSAEEGPTHQGQQLSLASEKSRQLLTRRTAAQEKAEARAGPGWGDGGTTDVGKYVSEEKQVPRDSAWGYEEYGGPPPGTVFSSVVEACDQCIAFYPEKLEGGGKFRSPEYEDPKGGKWARRCRAGPCNFREPQTQPWGGVLGAGAEPDPSVGWWKPPDNGICISLDPIFNYVECEPVLQKNAQNTHDLVRYCGYEKQIAPLPMDFAGAKGFFKRLGGDKQDCAAVIRSEGEKFYDDASPFDSDLQLLSGCCESIYEAVSCVMDEGLKKTKIIMSDLEGFDKIANTTHEIMTVFEEYCGPLCAFSESEFCDHLPTSDKCAKYTDCVSCVNHTGTWCPGKDTCTETGYAWCAKTPMGCKPPPTPAPPGTTTTTTTTPALPIPPKVPPPEPQLPPCKYLEAKKIWSQQFL